MRLCKVCGLPIPIDSKNYKYCSVKCKNAALEEWAKAGNYKKYYGRYFKSEHKICKICGNDFETKYKGSKHYCEVCDKKRKETHAINSAKWLNNKLNPKIYTCLYCGKEFKKKSRTANIYCSRECAFAHRAELAYKNSDDYKKSKLFKQLLKLLKTYLKNEEKLDFIVKSKYKLCSNCGYSFFAYKNNMKICPTCRLKNKAKSKKYTLVMCSCCGAYFVKKSKTQKYCSVECANRADNSKKDHRLDGKIIDDDITLERLMIRDNCTCALCGGLIDTTDYIIKDGVFIAGNMYPSIDHVLPIAKGGLHSWDNVQLAHRICNSIKSDSC